MPIHRPLELVKGAPDTIAAMRRSMSRALASAPCCLSAPDVDGRIHRCMAALVAQADAGRSLTRPAEDTSRFLDCPSDGVGCSRRVLDHVFGKPRTESFSDRRVETHDRSLAKVLKVALRNGSPHIRTRSSSTRISSTTGLRVA